MDPCKIYGIVYIWGCLVEIELIFHSPSNEKLGAFYQDYTLGMDDLGVQGRFDDRDKMKSLYLEHVSVRLGRKTPEKLGVYLRQRNVWKRHNGFDVYRTSDPPPAICYAVPSNESAPEYLYITSICADYPRGSSDEWWESVVKPRIGAL